MAIPSSVTRIEEDAFKDCSVLANVTIPLNVIYIGPNAFSLCDSLSSIQVEAANSAYCSDFGVLLDKAKTTLITCPAGWVGAYEIPSGVIHIGDSSFSNCDELTTVVIPRTVTEIGSFAFQACNKLGNITIPSSVTNIAIRAFQVCSSLARADFLGNAPNMGSDVFISCAPGFTVYYLPGKSGFTSPTWNGYPSAVLGGVAILPPEISSETEYADWVLTNAVTWNGADFTAIPSGDFERAWLLNEKPRTNMAENIGFQVAQFVVGSNQILVMLGLGVANQPKTGPVNGWLAVDGRESMTNEWQTIAGQTTGQNKLSFSNGQTIVVFDKPAGINFFQPKLQKDVPNSGTLLPLN